MSDPVEPRSGRSFSPRRGLPTSRAVLGALLVTVAAVGSFALANGGRSEPTTEYLVLRSDLEPGDTVALNDVSLMTMDLPPDVAASALSSVAGIEGATALHPLHSGAVLDVRDLNVAAFVDGEPVVGVHELTIPVPRDRSPAVLHRGDRVTVLAYGATDGVLRTALEDALVLTYQTDEGGLGSSDEGRLTLALTDADHVTAATVLSYDSLTVVLTSRAIDDAYPAQSTRELS